MDQTISEVFGAVSRELRQLAALTSSLQDQLSTRGYEDLDVRAFQSVDCLNQTLDCLATYVAHVGALVPEGRAIPIDDAADHICLSALADRLRGDVDPAMVFAASEVELF